MSLDPKQSSSKPQKTDMCLINELVRGLSLRHEYRLVSESGPGHRKTFTVNLKLGDFENYEGIGPSIKKAQQAAAARALSETKLTHSLNGKKKKPSTTPTVELNVYAMKHGLQVNYVVQEPRFIHPTCCSCPSSQQVWSLQAGQRYMASTDLYEAIVTVGQCQYLGSGRNPQSARHSAAQAALDSINSYSSYSNYVSHQQTNGSEQEKSAVSSLIKKAQDLQLPVDFQLVQNHGPSHLPTFVTRCTVGQFMVQSQGHSKKESKKKAASDMLRLLSSVQIIQSNTVVCPGLQVACAADGCHAIQQK